MVNKFVGFLLILLVPMQAMAALNMGLQLQTTHIVSVSVSNGVAGVLNSYPCHQEAVVAFPEESALSASAEHGGCYSCTLCMAFGLTQEALFLATADHLSQSVSYFTKSFVSAELIRSSKPPIL